MDAIADAQNAGPERQKFQGLLREATIDTKVGPEKVLLLKPQTYYNDSGNSVSAAARFHKIDVDHVVVFHDEIDLAPGKIRVKKGGGLAGNNGLRSTAAHLGPDFWRVRIGVGHPGRKEAVMPHVLGDFSKAEQDDWLDELMCGIGRAIPHLLALDDEAGGRFMSAIVQPAAPDRQKKKEADLATKPTAQPSTPEPTSPFDALKALKKDSD